MTGIAAALPGTRLAIVDLETTGAHPAWDRITEIAVIEIDDGEVSAHWSTLIDPQCAIPGAIQALTGITNEMVAGAPKFAAIAEELFERLDGRLFVAHNARFDYGFLRHAFEREGRRFQSKSLCTVKLSRRLFPQHNRHNLDSLITRHDLQCRARHRATGDAEAVWQFLNVAIAAHGPEVFATAVRQIARQTTIPPQLDPAMLEALPASPGVYVFYDERDTPIYIGKSIDVRSRVRAHFADDLRSSKEMQLAREVRRIGHERCAGELGALLREAELIKDLTPAFNRKLRRANDLCGFVLDTPSEPPANPEHVLRLVSANELDGALVPELRGVFRSRRSALAALRGLADAHQLCLQTLGYEKTSGRARRSPSACFRHQLKRCAGVCVGRESIAAHHARLVAALAQLERVAWPWPGPIGIVEADSRAAVSECDADAPNGEMHVIDHWCWLGTVRAEDELNDLLTTRARPVFDLDHYRILARHLEHAAVRIVQLPSRNELREAVQAA